MSAKSVSRAEPQRLGLREAVRVLGPAAAATGAAAVVAAGLAPPDRIQGQWQRLMYVHVPAAWLAYLCFGVVLLSGVAHLRHRSPGSARWGRAAAEVGVVATVLTLVSGSVWGRAVWGVWWTWDARLVSTAAMLLVYVAYLGVATLPGEQARVRHAAAVMGCACFAIVPVVHFSVTWWTTLHQKATVFGAPQGVPPIDPRMALALVLSVLAVTTIGLGALVWRVDHLRRASARTPTPADATPLPSPRPTGTPTGR